MADKTMPTTGSAFYRKGMAVYNELGVVAGFDTPDRPLKRCEANAEIGLAAFNAAHEVRQMGFDPVEAVRRAPTAWGYVEDAADIFNDLLAEDYLPDTWRSRLAVAHSYYTELVERARKASAAAKEGTGHE